VESLSEAPSAQVVAPRPMAESSKLFPSRLSALTCR
jgi:hypothetical protein